MSEEKFSGDMSRNEVEIDLNKFMAMVSEIGELKAKIMELENDKQPDNPWQKWIWLSNMIDAWRIFPRAFLSVYIILLYKCTIWFMELPAPNTPESRTRNKDEKVRGKMAGSFLKDAVDSGAQVVIQTKLKDSRGKYGRVLGNVIVDGININQQMIDNYLAVAYFGQSKNDIEAEHLVNREKLIELGKFEPVI